VEGVLTAVDGDETKWEAIGNVKRRMEIRQTTSGEAV
jgi:hypothetical protein